MLRGLFGDADIKSLLFWGLAVRLIMMAYSILYHDVKFRVKYTDIDYGIITDGAWEMLHGGSPFDRATFRYTPLLAVLMFPSAIWIHAGKLVFVACDIGAAYYCYTTLIQFATIQSAKRMISLFILFNPIVINVSTRGNSDMVISFMSLIVVSKFFEKKYYESAAWLGFAIHFKIYPIMYCLALLFGLMHDMMQERDPKTLQKKKGSYWEFFKKIFRCGLIVVVCCVVPTLLCAAAYGRTYLWEAVFYHFFRQDHRHNLSPYWYPIYLNQGLRWIVQLGQAAYSDISKPLRKSTFEVSFFSFMPQFTAVVVVSYKLRKNIAHACCVITMLFVAFNKVCTVQYFVWFLPFLPFVLCTPKRVRSDSLRKSANDDDSAPKASPPGVFEGCALAAAWLFMLIGWMLTTVQLEFYGKNWFGALWVVSAGYFLVQLAATRYMALLAIHQQNEESVLSSKDN